MRLTQPFYAEIVAHTTTRNQKHEYMSFAKMYNTSPLVCVKKRGRPHYGNIVL